MRVTVAVLVARAVADILDSARGGARKTHLMYHCNMSFVQLKKYLKWLIKTRLVFVENNGSWRLFRISDKGRSFLESYESLKALME